jgi:C-terminal processing protease CtpA/Prc
MRMRLAGLLPPMVCLDSWRLPIRRRVGLQATADAARGARAGSTVGALLACLLLGGGAAAQERGALFERVCAELAENFWDDRFRRQQLPELAAKYRDAAHAAQDRDGERAVIHAFLGEVPASHLALYSASTYEVLDGDLRGKGSPGLGCTLTAVGASFFVDNVLHGGPAAQAGLRRGDRVVSIDGEPTGASPRLDWRSDDAFLPDPPTHLLLVEDGEQVAIGFEREPGQRRTVELRARVRSAFAASRSSLCVFEQHGHRFGYLHLWMVFHARAARLLAEACERCTDCDGILLDLRGRGGSALEVLAIVRELERAAAQGQRFVCLVDSRTRSAKEVLAFEIQKRGLGTLVGERTAGAVLPATFTPVGDDSVLMYPATRLGTYSQAIEGKGVHPDVLVQDRLPFAAGDDPILAAGREVLEDLLE